MKEHLFCNVEGYSGQSSEFVDAERKYDTKVYNIILIFIVWTASNFLPTNVVNVLVFAPDYTAWKVSRYWVISGPYLDIFHAVLNSWNIYSKLISFRITCFTLNSIRDKKVLHHKNHKEEFCRTNATGEDDKYQ